MDHNAHARPSELGALVHKRAGPCGRVVAAAVAAAGFLIAAVVAAPAFAGTATNQRPFLFAFDGSDATGGRFTAPRSIAVDDSTGAVYVAQDAAGSAPGFVSKFDSAGTAAGFSALGASSLFAPGGGFTNLLGVAVDNSGGPNDGRVHVSQFGGTRLWAFARSGDFLWSLPLQAQAADVAVDGSGHPWVSPSFGGDVTQYESSGSPPGPTGCSIAGGAAAIDVDAAGNVYLSPAGLGPVTKLVGAGGCSFTSSTLDPSARNVYADQVGGHIFTVADADFEEYDQSGGLVATYGSDYVQSSFAGSSIAYNGSLDRVYVAQMASDSDPAPLVAAFGAPVSGTIPDVATDPAASVGVAAARFSGTVDPQGQAGSYRFEWRRTNSSWAAAALSSTPDHVAGSSPPQPLPAGPGASAVSFDAQALRGNTSYQVRLVTVNDTNGLRSVSSAQDFTTARASASPAVSIEPTSAIEARAATVTGTINPQGDTADWRTQLSTRSNCVGGFSNSGPLHSVSPPSSSPVAVSATVTGLLPDQRYCVRITATNSAGTTTSAVGTFNTALAVPSQVFSAFAAPRLDTSARLNGRVDPEGAELTYHFEYSADDGASWTALPATTRPDDNAREQVVVSQEATGLRPDTAYRFRFVASNAAGEADPQGAELGFRTRTSAAVQLERSCPNAEVRQQQQTDSYLPDCRGIELVNNPDKGNQNIFASIRDSSSHPMTSDGDRVLWFVTGGAPGGTTSSGTSFLAERTPDGWVSRGLAPPPEEQVGGGDVGYTPIEATPTFERFVFQTGSLLRPGNSLVRLDRDQRQDVLAGYDGRSDPSGGRLEVSDDGRHVLVINPDTQQLEDIGTGTGEVVSLMPDGSPSQCGLDLVGSSFAGWSASGRAAGAHWNSGYRMISTQDAARVYFETRPNGDCGGSFGLYQRNRATGQTILIDPGSVGRDVEFIRATPDGRQAYFASFSGLDAADQNSGGDVYRWDEQSGQSSCLTCVVPNANIHRFGFGLVPILISDDFSHVYFQSQERLVPGHGEAGALNTYVLSGGSIRFVAGPGVGRLGTALGRATAYLSADGNALVFQAHFTGVGRNVTADKLAAGCRVNPANDQLGFCVELYRYDDRDGSVECISCRRDGTTTWTFGIGGGLSGSDFRISADGGTVAFITGQALVDRDVNQSFDVYRWRDGAVQLLTDGVREFPLGVHAPRVRGVDADAENILFSVAAPGWTGFEQDGLSNLYVARVGGGFAPPPAPAPACSGDDCAAPPSAAPAAPVVGSLGFAGPGNAPESRRPRLVLAGRRVITGTRFTLRVKVPARGALSARGRGVKTIHRRAPKAGTYKLTLRLTKRARRTLARRHRLRVPLRVGFAPSSGGRQRAPFAVTLRQPKASSSGARQARAATNDRGAAK